MTAATASQINRPLKIAAIGARFWYCFSTFKGFAAQVRGFRRSSSLTPRRQIKLSIQSYDGIFSDASRPAIGGENFASALTRSTLCTVALRTSASTVGGAGEYLLRCPYQDFQGERRTGNGRQEGCSPDAAVPGDNASGGPVVSGSGQPAATFSNARIGTAEGATQTVTAGTLSCHPRGQTAEMGVKKFERHALRRVVALFSPARSDEGAAGCADFAGCIGRVDFDPTTPLFTRPYNRQNRNKSNRGRAAIGDGQQQGTGSNRGRAATGRNENGQG